MPAPSSSPMPAVVGHLASTIDADELAGAGLAAALAKVADPRKRRGVRHQITAILGVTVCAVLAGCRSFAAIGEWAANASEQVLAALEVDADPPCESTIRRVLQRLDGDMLDTVLGRWAAARTTPPAGTRRAVAIDGKTARGSASDTNGARHLLAAIDQRAGVVLGQADVAGKTNEIPMFPVLCNNIPDLADAVVTADAMHCQKSHADSLVLERGAHYVLTVKDNQPALRTQLKALPWKDIPPAHTCSGRGHGRVEHRTVKVVTVQAGIGFPHARQALQITRRTRKPASKKWSTEIVYAVTSLTAEQASADELASWIRGHWTVENRLHWVRDVTYDEDRCQVRTGTGPRAMASLRNLAISVLRINGVTNISQALRHHAWDPLRPVTLLLTS